MRIGSEEHLTLLCREFIETHRAFDPTTLPWPALDETGTAKLRSLPFWDEAIRTEQRTGAKVSAYAALESPPLLREAVALQGYEERRHAQLLATLVERYGIAIDPGPEGALPRNLEWAFTRTGYGECIDSFFAFGLFALARDAEFLPHPLLDLLEPIVQEEARHILFLVNWVAYKRHQRPRAARPLHRARCVAAFAGAAYDRTRSAGNIAGGGVSKDGFTASGAGAIGGDFSLREFVARCLAENAYRFAPYDPRLLRPRLVPTLARAYLMVTGWRRPARPALESTG
ncbi:MAG: ferritin-like domain-containing protein [Deltaproteobacteria bacterium]|nr:ferritin-like domain-containing protein [Deltaproteobacteria bacterium]